MFELESRFSEDGLVHDKERLKELQALPLDRKIGITIARITEWYNYFNGNVYVSMSGGKDSTVLYDIVHKLFPDVPAVFSNTGLEYPELTNFAKEKCDVVVKPKMSFLEVIKQYGYPVISKEVSEAIYYARRNSQSVNVERERERLPRTVERKRLELLGRRTYQSRKELFEQRKGRSCCPEECEEKDVYG